MVIPVTNGVPVKLYPGVKYTLRNNQYGTEVTGLVDLIPSKRGREIGLQNAVGLAVSSNGKIRLDGTYYEAVQGNAKNISTKLVLEPGYDGEDVPYLALQGSYLAGGIPGVSKYNPVAAIEAISRLGSSSGGGSVAIDADVASGASGSGELLSPTYMQNGELLVITWGISHDSVGTSPHAPYILVLDPQSTPILKVRGVVNPYGSVIVRVSEAVSSSAPYTFSYENGDSVSHWFLLAAYTI